MSYIKKEWKVKDFQKGDQELVNSLNHMEQGIAEGGGGGSSYSAGDGISIENNVISVNQTVAKKQEVIDEANTRTTADNALQEGINQEEIARAEADATLQANITAEETRAKAEEAKKLEAYTVTVNGGTATEYKGPANVPVFFELVPGTDKVTVKSHAITLNTTKEQNAVVNSLDINAATESSIGLMTADDAKALRTDLPQAISVEKSQRESEYAQLSTLISGKQDKLTAGTNITINNNTISATDTTYTAGTNIKIEDNKISAEAGQLALEGTSGTLTAEQLTLLANKSVNILRDTKIHRFSSASSTSSGELRTYDLIIDNNVCPMYHYILVNMLSGSWNAYTTNLQDKLVAGENITISDTNVISAASGTTVVANPTLAGTEAELAGIQVGDTKYKVPSNISTFPAAWPIEETCENFLKAVAQDSTAVPGKTYLGGVKFSDLDEIGLGNAEAEVEIINSTLSTGYKIIRLNIYSATNEPYSWARIYYWTGSSGMLRPWQITARAADQYTTPVATGTVNNTTGVVTFTSGSWTAGVYLISMYGQQGGNNTSRTYYFAYGGHSTWMCYSGDCFKSRMSSLNGSLIYTDDTGTGGPNWDSDPTIEIYKMR